MIKIIIFNFYKKFIKIIKIKSILFRSNYIEFLLIFLFKLTLKINQFFLINIMNFNN